MKILKKEPDAKTKQKETVSTKNSLKLLLHMLSNAWGYRCVSKKAEESLAKYIVPQRQARASSVASLLAPSKASQLEEKLLHLTIIGAALFEYLAKQKGIEIFAISMQDIDYQLNKNKRPPTDPATKVPECYHNSLDVFSKEASNTISAHSKHNHVIRLLGEKDHDQATLRAMLKEKLAFIKKFLEDNLKKGFIEASSAPCFLPIMLAVKPGSGIQFCVDYRKLNELTKKDAYSIPLIAETLAQLSHARVFTKIDIRQVFHKLHMAAELEDLTTMITWFGTYKWKVLLFGLTGEPALWQRFINNVLWEYLNWFCTAYLDNILIYSRNLQEHKKHVCSVLTKLREFGIQANVNKCKFHVTKIKYLSLIISKDGIKMDSAKVEAIKNWSTPKHVKDV